MTAIVDDAGFYDDKALDKKKRFNLMDELIARYL